MGQRDVNPDGTPRQDIIATLSVGDRLTLGHQPTKFDPNAIAVVAAGGTIGYLPSKHSEVLIGLLEETSSVRAAVKRIVEDEVNQSLVRGVWMRIELRGLQARQIDKAQGEDTGEDGEVPEADGRHDVDMEPKANGSRTGAPSSRRRRALEIIKANPGIFPSTFSQLMWPPSQSQGLGGLGRGSIRRALLRVAAGWYLAKLERNKLIRWSNLGGYWLDASGWQVLADVSGKPSE